MSTWTSVLMTMQSNSGINISVLMSLQMADIMHMPAATAATGNMPVAAITDVFLLRSDPMFALNQILYCAHSLDIYHSSYLVGWGYALSLLKLTLLQYSFNPSIFTCGCVAHTYGNWRTCGLIFEKSYDELKKNYEKV